MKILHPESTKNPDWKTIGFLLPYLWSRQNSPLKIRVLISLFFLIFAKISNIYVPIFYKKAIDILTTLPSHPSFWMWGPVGLILAYGAARIGAQMFNELKDVIFATVQQNAIRTLALETFQHLHTLSLRFHLDRKTGLLSRVIERGTSSIETFMRFMVWNILPTFVEIIFVGLILWRLYDVRYALVTLFTLGVYITFTILFTEWRIQFVRQMNKADGQANGQAVDSLLNFETVKYFGNEAHEARRYDVFLALYEKAFLKSARMLSVLNIGQGLIIASGLMGVMILAYQGIVNKTMTVGDFVLVTTYLIQLYLPLNVLGFAYREVKLALVNMEEMFLLLTKDGEIKDIPHASPLKIKGGRITFEHVNFSYQPDRVILEDISFEVPKGQTFALVGASGSGKSTLSRLLFRFFEVSEGRILIDGQDIRDVTQESLRAAIGIVPQDTVLFNETIYYNIAYGHPSATESEVHKAATLAKIHDFIQKLPQGYQTLVGERGLKLSGGEKQRVAIARTLLKKPKIFLFDEATSALDTHTEKEIQASLREVSQNRTTLMIAHRLSTIKDADQILVLDQGKIVERGTHRSLLAHKGLYAQMWHKQLSEHEAAHV